MIDMISELVVQVGDIVYYIGDNLDLKNIKNVKLRVIAVLPDFIIALDDNAKEFYHFGYDTISYDGETPILCKIENTQQYRILLQAMVYNKETGEVYQTTSASRDIIDHEHLINHIDQLINDYTKT